MGDWESLQRTRDRWVSLRSTHPTPRRELRGLGIVIDQQIIPGANHFFDGKLEPLMETVTGYLDMRLANVR